MLPLETTCLPTWGIRTILPYSTTRSTSSKDALTICKEESENLCFQVSWARIELMRVGDDPDPRPLHIDLDVGEFVHSLYLTRFHSHQYWKPDSRDQPGIWSGHWGRSGATTFPTSPTDDGSVCLMRLSSMNILYFVFSFIFIVIHSRSA